jgi:hypothetical protein
MDHTEANLALRELRAATEALLSATDGYDIDELEIAVGRRERAVARFEELVLRNPAGFSADHLESARESLRIGKQAFERLLEIRRTGWATATELSKNEYVLRSLSTFATSPADI